jgi:hypothetical protein
MADDTGTTAAAAETGAQPQGQDGAPGVKFQPPSGGTGGPGASAGTTAGAGDRSAEELLSDALSDDGDGKDGDTASALKTAQAELAKWKTQARENEKRAKANADKAKNYDAYEESQKSEQQKLADRASAAEQRATEAEGRYFRTLAAATYDLPVSMIDQLGTGTEDEINARAETLAAAINERAAVLSAAQAQANGQQRGGNGAGFRPVESLRPGGLPASGNKPSDPNAWIRQALGKR